jgi:hypothetical protein
VPLIEELLAAADSLPYHGRMRLFADRSRELAATGELDSHLAQLGDGDDFARETGLFLAEVAGRLEAVRAYLGQPNWRLQERALRILMRTGGIDPAAALAELTDALGTSRAGRMSGGSWCWGCGDTEVRTYGWQPSTSHWRPNRTAEAVVEGGEPASTCMS